MKLEKQVVSLELSKKLKELGVKQDSLFYWHTNKHGHPEFIRQTKENEGSLTDLETHSAFTVAELGEMLPFGAKSYVGSHSNDLKVIIWVTEYHSVSDDWECGDEKFAKTEADARAKMLIYLIENKLIKLAD